MKTVDVIIPVYKPDEKYIRLIEALEHQTCPIREIIVMNTEQKYYDNFFFGHSFKGKYNNIKVRHLSKFEFDHGQTRNDGVKRSDADYFLMMTDDAVPADEFLVEHLLTALEDEQVAVAYARQLAGEESGVLERYTRQFNYPETSHVKYEKDLQTMGIKTYFCSNVCALYNRKIFEQLGGFIRHTIFNEDMIYAATAIKAGFGIAYVADAKVYHAHKYTNRQQFTRNFDLAVSQADHPEVFAEVSSEGEGIRMVKGAVAHLKQTGQKKKIPELIIQSGCKYMGYKLGKSYQKLPMSFVKKCSMNKEYWNRKSVFTAAEHIDATKGYGKSELETRFDRIGETGRKEDTHE